MCEEGAEMPAEAVNRCNTDKRASLVASKVKWSRVDEEPRPILNADGKAGNYKQDSVQQWLITSCQEPVKSDSDLEATEPLKRQPSSEDDLVLGVEASLYGKNPAVNTVQEFLRSQQLRASLVRWNSLTSAISAHSGTLSVMDVLNLWHDDPEELLLELGFGCEEPDISVRIPARFINHQSQARGINLQVFLDAQKNRMDLENPDVSNRFRQLEVLQQVTSAFSALVPMPPPPPAPAGAKLSAAARERRKKLSMLFRRASKKTLSMNQSQQSLPGDPSANQEHDPSDRRAARKHSRPGPPRKRWPRPSGGGAESPLRKKSPGDMKAPESFEIEEIHSFDEGSAGRTAAETGEVADAKFMRTNSCQSDSSGFLEEPVIPCLSLQASPVPELIKALHTLSGDSTDNQENSEFPNIMDSRSSLKECSDIPYGTVRDIMWNESSKLPCSSSQGHQGAAESAQTAGPEPDGTTDRDGRDIFQYNAVEMGTRFVPNQMCDDGEDPGAGMSSFGETEIDRAVRSASPGEPVTLLCHKCKNSLPPHGGTVAHRGGSETGWREESLDSDFPHQEESEAEVGSESPRRDWASFGSSKSVSVQMSSTLPSVSQTTRRRCPAPPLDLQREIADAMATATSSRGRGRRLSQGRSRKRSASLDTGLAREEEEEEEEEVGRWEAGLIAGAAWCCCVCDHRCSCCSSHTHRPAGEHNGPALQQLHHTASRCSAFTFSLDELEGMMRCMRKFRCVLGEIEERAQEEETQVYNIFSDLDREDMASVQELRGEVRKEAELLETQLTELAQHCDAGITTKMQRLLDEQSQLCMQLRIPLETPRWGPALSRQATPAGPASPMQSRASGRTVATQCCLLPDLLVSGASMTGALPGTQCSSPPPEGDLTTARVATQLNQPDKQDLLAFCGFLSKPQGFVTALGQQ
ncbi:hypothetical protein SKAU_G00075860 [Synaphobranchus kaupii]|uniref:ITPR-interacting domain-containing protein n=1 Tax=Synaphobranchus kaupii TaxID=118154 RepID=A0A9Q1G860_SYNKA|nr:hypothetical protein SKAU_G00075860 [Synaphobranchus kaupii]